MNELKIIDFTGGIRSGDIQDNFNVISDQISRERLSVAGYGISSGLELSINGFFTSISEGSLIGRNGAEAFLDSKTVKIEKPRLSGVIDKVFLIESEGKITLDNIPYCLHRESAVTINSINSGLYIYDYSTNERISLRAINDNILVVDSSYAGSLARISYSYTNKRYDTIYINKDKEIKSIEGTTSSSPSAIIPTDSMYVLGYIEVDPLGTNEKNERVAKLIIREDARNVRNLYTDKNNKLYICGTLFDDLQIIHMTQPSTPHSEQLWYDFGSNKLKVWKEIDGTNMWVNVNDTSIVPALESYIFTPENNPQDGKTFIFPSENINLRYVPGKNSLDIRIDQGVLHRDQFSEVTMSQARGDASLRELLTLVYGYDGNLIDSVDEEIENIGIGFKLSSPLDQNCYVEALVTQRTHENPLFKRFQRTSTFVSEGSFQAAGAYNTFTIDGSYLFGENQLEVYVDGKKLVRGREYLEGKASEYVYENNVLVSPKAGNLMRTFTIKLNLPTNSTVVYRISTNINSYDHIEKIMGDLKESIDTSETVSNQAIAIATALEAETNLSIAEINSGIDALIEKSLEHDTFMKKTDKISADNLNDALLKKTITGFINKTLTKTTGSMMPAPGIKKEDFIVMYNISGNIMLRRTEEDLASADGDYYVENTESGTIIMFKETASVEEGASLYITGMQIG